MTEFNGDIVGKSSREKTTQWLETVLQTYYSHVRKKESGNQNGDQDDPSSVRITVSDFDIGPGYSAEERLATLSDLLSIKVWYKIDDNTEDKTEQFIVKIPPNDMADREMAHLAQVDKREIHFYTEALVQLQDYIDSKKTDITLSVPRCYFARYHTAEDSGDANLSVIISEAESVLVLEDIRPNGYCMREFSTGLTIDETKAALREIAIFHASSWSLQESIGIPLQEKWKFAYRPKKAASAYKMMLEQGFPTLAGFLEKQEPDGSELLHKLKALHPKAADLLCQLLEPPPSPAPSCLTHMDFWCNNLLFRVPTPDDKSEATTKSLNDERINSETECKILDWQMMSVSRPTHDVALLLFTSLNPEVRQENTSMLLQHYWAVFQETVKKLGQELPFDYSCIEEEFKKSQLLALLLVVGSIDLALDVEATESRLMNALRDMARDGLL